MSDSPSDFLDAFRKAKKTPEPPVQPANKPQPAQESSIPKETSSNQAAPKEQPIKEENTSKPAPEPVTLPPRPVSKPTAPTVRQQPVQGYSQGYNQKIITMRYDTAMCGIIVIVMLMVVSFFFGYYMKPDAAPVSTGDKNLNTADTYYSPDDTTQEPEDFTQSFDQPDDPEYQWGIRVASGQTKRTSREKIQDEVEKRWKGEKGCPNANYVIDGAHFYIYADFFDTKNDAEAFVKAKKLTREKPQIVRVKKNSIEN